MTSLSILIPARNEQFLSRTIEDILANIEGDTDIIAVLDGQWAHPPIVDHPRVTLIYHPQPIGQRAATNEAARISTAKYLMKLDAHCSMDKGFDVKLMADMQDDWCIVPVMKNLHAFNWRCQACGNETYQGPYPTVCARCESSGQFEQVILWFPKPSPNSKAYCFDSEPHFQYFREFSKRPEGKGELTETMSLQGSCFMMTRDKYFELDVCDESFGSWGSQGIEVACKFWLSGGQVMVSHKTFYAHLFRTQGADFGFPYHLSGKQVDHAKRRARELFFEGKWDKAIRPLSWVLEKFWPVNGWTIEDLEAQKARESKRVFKPIAAPSQPTKAIIYYTDCRLDPSIMTAVQNQITRSVNGHELISVSLKPIDFGQNIVIEAERSILTMFKQILAGLEASTADIVYLCEHDILYHSSHFDFVPPDRSKIFYNTNVWHLRASDGHAVTYTAKRLSQLCAYRDVLLEHYRKRVAKVEAEGFSYRIGFEPGSHRRAERIDDLQSETWRSKWPNVDIKHGKNLTPARWSPDAFRDSRNCKDWVEAGAIPYWGQTEGRFEEFLEGLQGQRVNR
jgi:hypothetical protein